MQAFKFLEIPWFRRKNEDQVKQWQRDSDIGARLETVLASGALDILAEEVFSPMNKEAFTTFQTLDPTDFTSVVQAQKIGQVLSEITKRVERKIELGRYARMKLKELLEES